MGGGFVPRDFFVYNLLENLGSSFRALLGSSRIANLPFVVGTTSRRNVLTENNEVRESCSPSSRMSGSRCFPARHSILDEPGLVHLNHCIYPYLSRDSPTVDHSGRDWPAPKSL